MAYSTDQNIFDRLGQQKVAELSNDAGDGTVDQDLLSRLRESAARTIDRHLRPRYDLPISDAGATEQLADLEVDLLAYKLYARRPTAEAPDEIRDAWKAAKADLEDIREHGGLGIDADSDGEPDGESTTQVRRRERPTFRDRLDSTY